MKLAWWRSQIESMYAGKAEHPVTQALEPHVHAYDLSADRLYAIVEGMEMDLDQDRYADWASLRKHCWHAAGVVGELSASIFDYTQPETLVYAQKLGQAFHLNNIIRESGAGARFGRIYRIEVRPVGNKCLR